MTQDHRRVRDRWWVSAVLWVIAVALMLSTAVYQRRTGPTHPLQGSTQIGDTAIDFALIRSANTGADALVAIPEPGVPATLHFRRYPTDDPYTAVPMQVQGDEAVAPLPFQPPAGKLDYYLRVDGTDGAVTIPADRTAVIRFKGAVPAAALVPHILLMFFAVLWGIRTLLEALVDRRGIRWMSWTTLGLVGLGGMVMGPVVQKYAFGAAWTGVPFGWDLTDNKTLLMFVVWIAAAAVIGLRRPLSPRARWAAAAASLVMLAVYLVPHSMYGSELDYEQVDEGVDPAEAIGQG